MYIFLRFNTYNLFIIYTQILQAIKILIYNIIITNTYYYYYLITHGTHYFVVTKE